MRNKDIVCLEVLREVPIKEAVILRYVDRELYYVEFLLGDGNIVRSRHNFPNIVSARIEIWYVKVYGLNKFDIIVEEHRDIPNATCTYLGNAH